MSTLRDFLRSISDNPEDVNFKLTFVHVAIFAAIFFIFYSISVCYSQKKMEYREKIAQKSQLEQDIGALERENGGLRNRIAFLNTSEGVELIAREKLGLIKPKEIAFVVISTPSPGGDGEKSGEDNKERTLQLKKEIIKESQKKEGWLGTILNRLWGR